jgi:hypothetical protein
MTNKSMSRTSTAISRRLLDLLRMIVLQWIVDTKVVKFLTVTLSTDNIDVSAESLGHYQLSRAPKDIISHPEILSLLHMKLTSDTQTYIRIYLVMHERINKSMDMMYRYVYIIKYIYTYKHAYIHVYICMDTYSIDKVHQIPQ